MRTVLIALLTLVLTSYGVALVPVAQASPSPALPPTEAAALTFMREEEKLARDVYQALSATWSLPMFANIAASEQTHMDAIKTLLDRYGIADPAAGSAPGVFTNQDLRTLYTQLLARGTTSLPEALAVGAAIEELDILDLQQRTTTSTPADIAQVYTRLREASENHLRAFVRQWEAQTGRSYEPQYLDDDAYQAIVVDARSGGRANGGGRGNRGGRGRP